MQIDEKNEDNPQEEAKEGGEDNDDLSIDFEGIGGNKEIPA